MTPPDAVNCCKPMKCHVIGGAAIIALCYGSNGFKPLPHTQSGDEQTAPAPPGSAASWYPRNTHFPPHLPQTQREMLMQKHSSVSTLIFPFAETPIRITFFLKKISFTSIVRSYLKKTQQNTNKKKQISTYNYFISI